MDERRHHRRRHLCAEVVLLADLIEPEGVKVTVGPHEAVQVASAGEDVDGLC